jgi:pilus assembly protein CpaF
LAALGGVGRDALHAQLSGAVQVILHVHRGPQGRVLREIAAVTRAEDGRTGISAAVVKGVITEPGATVLSRMLQDRGVPAPW